MLPPIASDYPLSASFRVLVVKRRSHPIDFVLSDSAYPN
jgi:hypothetical protein